MNRSPDSRESTRRSLPALESWTQAIFVRAGVEDASAATAAARLLLADAMGVRTHGVARLPSYWSQLRSGGLNPRPAITHAWRGQVLHVAADLALGQVVGPRTFDWALDALGPDRAFVPFLIRNAGHLGALGTHVVAAAEAGKVAFLCQVTQPVMAPEGAGQPAIGNNPIAFAAPRPDAPPFVFDVAASRVARGKVHVAARDGTKIPLGWAIGPDGEPTDDPAVALAGSLLPAADHKGLALAMMVEVLAGALTGARPTLSSGGAPGGVGAFGFVCDPAAMAPEGGFASLMAAWTGHYEEAVQGAGHIPGQGAAAAREAAEREGLCLEPELEKQLQALGREAGIALPSPDV